MYGDAQAVTRNELHAKLAQKFASNLDAPILLFVQNASEAMDILRFYGVDTSDWAIIFEPIVGKDLLNVGDRLPKEDPAKQEDGRGRYDQGYARERSSDRSRSPKRGASSSRPRSPPRSIKHSVYVVDIERLYATMRRMPQQGLSVPQIAGDLDVKLEPPENVPVSNGWCAGNECR